MKPVVIVLFIILFLGQNIAYGEDEFPVLKGPYFGQSTPGITPKLFAPGIVSLDGRFEGAISFSPDFNEMYFGANDENDETHIYYSRRLVDKPEQQWAPIKRADFTKGQKDEEIHPFVSRDGTRIYFTGLNSDLTDTRIWYVNRLENGWSDAVKVAAPFNQEQVFFPNLSNKGNLFYFNLSKGGTYSAAQTENSFAEGSKVNIEFGHHVFVSADEDYFVMTARSKESDRRDNDVYVGFKDKNGQWTTPVNLGPNVNSTFSEKSPSITPDGKYLFFARAERKGKVGLGNIYWVSTQVIEDLRPR